MNLGKYGEKIILGIGLILIFSSSSTRFIGEFKHLTESMFLLGGGFIFIAALLSLIKSEWLIDKNFQLFTYFYASFIFFVILSIIVNGNFERESVSIERFVLMFVFLGFFLAMSEKISEGLIITSFMISAIIVFTYFLIEYPIIDSSLKAYRGGFGNPNSVGVLAVTLFSVSLVAGTSLLKAKQNYLIAFISLFISLGAAYLTIISSSRTSFLTLALIFAIVSVTFTYDVLKTRNLFNWKTIIITILVAFVGALLFVVIDNPVYAAFESRILDKFSRKIENGSITAGRISIWIPIIESTGLFGKGPGYFKEISGLSAHNSFMHMLSIYGWFAAIAYVVFWLFMLFRSVHYYLTEKLNNTYALLPLILVVNYISLSMMENMSIHVSAFLAMSMVAIFSKSKESKLEFEYNKYENFVAK